MCLITATEFLFITEILHEAEELWQRQSGSDASSEVGSVSSGSLSDGTCLSPHDVIALPSPRYVHTMNGGRNLLGNMPGVLPQSAMATAQGDWNLQFLPLK